MQAWTGRARRGGSRALLLGLLLTLLAACGSSAAPTAANGGQGAAQTGAQVATATPEPSPTGTPARPTPTATATPARTATPAAAQATAPRPATPGVARPAYTNQQLAADYAAVQKALAPRESNIGLYAVAVLFDYKAGTADTEFLLLSQDKSKLYKYRVAGRERAVAEAPGSPEPITPDASFTPFIALPWQVDGAWGGYLDKAASALVQGGWIAPGDLSRATLLALTGVSVDWQFTFEAGERRFKHEVRKGEVTFSKVEAPGLAANLPAATAQPWYRYVANQRFARDFRVEPFGLPDANGPNRGAGLFTPDGYRPLCAGSAASATCQPSMTAGLGVLGGQGGDIVVEVEFARLAGPDKAQYGLLFDTGKVGTGWLFFALDAAGYTVSTGQPARQTQVAQGALAPARNGADARTLVVVVAGESVRFFIDGAEVWQDNVAGAQPGAFALYTTSLDLKVAARYLRLYDAKKP